MSDNLQKYLNLLEQEKEQEENFEISPPVQEINTKPQPSYKTYEGYNTIVPDVPDVLPDSGFIQPKKSLADLKNDEEFATRAARFLESIGRNENIFEYLRDADYSLSSAIVRAKEVNQWTDEQNQDYIYLKEQFDNAELKGFKERFGMVKDIAIDVLGDPLNLVSALFALPTGGATFAGRLGLGKALGVGLKKYTQAELNKKALKQGVLYGAAEGAAWGGFHNYALQDIDIDLGLQDDIEYSNLRTSTLLGAGFNGLIGGATRYSRIKQAGTEHVSPVDDFVGPEMPEPFQQLEFKFSNEGEIANVGRNTTRKESIENYKADIAVQEPVQQQLTMDFGPSKLKEVKEAVEPAIYKSKNILNKILANTIGKPTTQFLEYAKESPLLQDLLEKFRYDYDVTMTSQGKKGVKRQSYGLAVGQRTGEYLYTLARAFNVLDRVGFRAKIATDQSDALNFLLRDKLVVATKQEAEREGKFWIKNLIGKSYKGVEVTEDLAVAFSGKDYNGKFGIRSKLDETFDDLNQAGLLKPGTRNKGGFFPRLFNYKKLEENRGRFEKDLIESGHANPINDIAEIEIKTTDGDIVRGIKEDSVGIDEDIFGENFLETAKRELGGEGTDAEIEALAKELKASKIVTNMLENRWTPFEIKVMTKSKVVGDSAGYLQARRFTNLDDNKIAYVLENDTQVILEEYFTNAARAIERSNYFGRNIADFYNNMLLPIRKQLEEKAGMTKEDADKVITSLRTMHKRVTGIETDSNSIFKTNGFMRGAADVLKLSQQMAHLPFATLSSITEPLLLLSRAGIEDAPLVLKDIGTALVKEGNSIIDRTVKGFQRGVLRQRVKGIKDIDDDMWGELYETGLALEQSVQERLEGLAGEGLHSNAAKLAQQGFFKVNLLTQWTKAVQLASYTTGKRLIRQRAKALYEHQKGLKPIMLTGKGRTSSTKYYIQQLNDLGVDEYDAIQWYKNSLDDTGKFNENLSKGLDNSGNLIKQKGQKGFGNDHFYKYSYTSGANRFTKEIILNPSTAEANRPLWFSTPAAQLLVQFAGYPTVFNNTILKRFSNELVNSPVQATPKIIGTVALMTAVAHVGNTIRSNGENLRDYETGLKKDETELLGEAVRRWGGYGPFDYAARYGSESERNVGGTTSLLKTFAGPLPQDLIDAVLYRKGLTEIGVTNMPGYAAYDLILGEGTKKDLRTWARGSDKDDTKKSKVLEFASGGLVYNVDNVHPEPDEVKMRGVNATYNEVAGIVLRDEEDRLFANKGGPIKDQMNRLGFASGTDEFGRPSVKTKQEDFYIPETEEYPEGPEDEGLKNVFIAPDVLGLVGVRAAKVASEVVEEGLSQAVTKAKYPKQVTHGGSPNLKKVTNAFDRYYKETGYKNPNLQAGVFAARDKGGHAQYTKAPGKQGYDLDTSSVSSVKNIVSKKGKVLNFTKPPKSLNKVFDKAITNKKELAKTAESNRAQRKFNKEASELERFQKMLFDKNTKGIGKMPESIRDVLVKEGYDIVSQPTYRYGVLNSPVGSEILLKEFPIK
jgi:hypothetical protein